METLALLLIVMFATFVLYRLGVFGSIEHLFNVATREATAYDREHKVRVAKRYEGLTADIDVEKVNTNVAVVDSFDFD